MCASFMYAYMHDACTHVCAYTNDASTHDAFLHGACMANACMHDAGILDPDTCMTRKFEELDDK